MVSFLSCGSLGSMPTLPRRRLKLIRAVHVLWCGGLRGPARVSRDSAACHADAPLPNPRDAWPVDHAARGDDIPTRTTRHRGATGRVAQRRLGRCPTGSSAPGPWPPTPNAPATEPALGLTRVRAREALAHGEETPMTAACGWCSPRAWPRSCA